MAEHQKRNVYVTPKCGLCTVRKLLSEANRDSDIPIIIIRNPYSRLVSFYINKVIYNSLHPDKISKISREELVDATPIKGYRFLRTDCTFSEFINSLKSRDINKVDRHLLPQSHNFNAKDFKILHLENYLDDIKILCNAVGIPLDWACSVRENSFPRNDKILEFVFDKPSIWFVDNGTPKDWRLFYNSELSDIVFQLYASDFKKFGYNKL